MPRQKGAGKDVPLVDYFIQERPEDFKNSGLTEVITIATEKDGVTEKVIAKHRARIYVNYGSTLAEAVQMYGEATVHKLYLEAAKVTTQNCCRPIILKNGSLLDVPTTWHLPPVKEEKLSGNLETFLNSSTPKQSWEFTYKLFRMKGMTEEEAIRTVTSTDGAYPGTQAEYDLLIKGQLTL